MWLRLEMWATSVVKISPGLWKDFSTLWIFSLPEHLPGFVQILLKFYPNPSFPTEFSCFDNDEVKNLKLCGEWYFLLFLKRRKQENGVNFKEMMWSESSKFCIVRVAAVTLRQKCKKGELRARPSEPVGVAGYTFWELTIYSDKLVYNVKGRLFVCVYPSQGVCICGSPCSLFLLCILNA